MIKSCLTYHIRSIQRHVRPGLLKCTAVAKRIKKLLWITVKPCNSAFSVSPEIFLRIYSVVERLKALGWGEELGRLDDDSDERPENHSIVIKACQKDITEKSKSSLRLISSRPLK